MALNKNGTDPDHLRFRSSFQTLLSPATYGYMDCNFCKCVVMVTAGRFQKSEFCYSDKSPATNPFLGRTGVAGTFPLDVRWRRPTCWPSSDAVVVQEALRLHGSKLGRGAIHERCIFPFGWSLVDREEFQFCRFWCRTPRLLPRLRSTMCVWF